MLKKNVKKQKNKNRPTWTGFYIRKTPTKKEKLEKIKTKYKGTDER